jgi:hypothetical protein
MSSSPKNDADAADKAEARASKRAEIERKVAIARSKLQQKEETKAICKIFSQERGTLPLRHLDQRYPFFFNACCHAIRASKRLTLRALCRRVPCARRPHFVSAFVSFSFMLLRRRFGGGVLIAELAKRLGFLSVAASRATPLEALVLKRVFGQQLIGEIAYDMRVDMLRMLHVQPLCEFMSELQVIVFEGLQGGSLGLLFHFF